MKKCLMIQEKKGLRPGNSFTFIAFIILCSFMLSCNNKTTESGGKPDSTEIKPADSSDTKNQNAFNGNFPYLTISKADLEAFFTPANVQKLAFRFQFADGTSAPSLVAFKATSIRVYDPTPLMPRLEKQSFGRSLGGELFLGNLEMNKQQFENLKRLPSYSNSTHLLFGAKKEGLNVTYEVDWVTMGFTKDTKFNFLPENDLNPSPPDPPSGTNNPTVTANH